ncbi:hypothetical protein LCGC14_2362320, partial [marine sediment metagenome]
PGGGGGGGGATGAGETAIAAGGSAGGYAEKLILESALSASETVTVGTKGDGGATGSNAGAAGSGPSSFGSHCSAGEGQGGSGAASSPVSGFTYEGASGAGSGGDINLFGQPGGRARRLSGDIAQLGRGGSSVLGPSNGNWSNSNFFSDGSSALNPGAGGDGGYSRSTSQAVSGGNGDDGIVIVEVYGSP